MATAFLILCDRPHKHLFLWAQSEPNARFYIHYDAKNDIDELDFLNGLNNVFILNDRHSVYWGGFSQVSAILKLFQAALSDKDNVYFHLVSGECVPLQRVEMLEREWVGLPEGTIFLESNDCKRLRYRVRFNAPHADTVWQRHFFGKVCTKILQFADKVIPSRMPCYTGSTWFSTDRGAALAMIEQVSGLRSQVSGLRSQVSGLRSTIILSSFLEKNYVPTNIFFNTSYAIRII